LVTLEIGHVLGQLGAWDFGPLRLGAADRNVFLRSLETRFTNDLEKIITQADRAAEGNPVVFGSPVQFRSGLGWHEDFSTDYTWPTTFSPECRIIDFGNKADIKFPWELNRCHHFVTLGQAYWLTGNEKYTRTFLDQIGQWIHVNPVLEGMNWINAMEPSIRSVNWLWAWGLFAQSPVLQERDKVCFLCSLIDHGRFIVRHLEVKPGVPSSNHYIADLAGLVHLGLALPYVREAHTWLARGLSGLLRELRMQIRGDGVSYESSTAYHRFVTELFGATFLLCRRHGVKIPDWAWNRLELMIEFVQAIARPDGKSPLIGDSDDGRLHVFSPIESDDHRHILGLGAHLFNRDDFAASAGPGLHDASWLAGRVLQPPASEPKNRGKSRAFPSTGIFALRHQDAFMSVTCRKSGPLTGHLHNDLLSFDLAALGQPWIVDIGTYCYTRSKRWRNHFRNTSAHNTIQIDGNEQNEFDEDDLFALGRDAEPVVTLWESNNYRDVLEAYHTGYQRLESPVTHRRRFTFEKKSKSWLIADSLEGKGRHQVEASLHFDSGVSIDVDGVGEFTAVGQEPDRSLRLTIRSSSIALTSDNFKIDRDWVSRSYGTKHQGILLRVTFTAQFPVVLNTCIFTGDERSRSVL